MAESIDIPRLSAMFHLNETVSVVTRSCYEGDSLSLVASILLSGFGNMGQGPAPSSW